jgi:hypothetical protein
MEVELQSESASYDPIKNLKISYLPRNVKIIIRILLPMTGSRVDGLDDRVIEVRSPPEAKGFFL